MAAVSSRYARAFADVVSHLKLDPPQVMQQLRALLEIFDSSPALRSVWDNPAIPAEQKRRVLDALVARLNLSKPVRNFGAVLIDHRRMGQLADIVGQVEAELDQRMGLAQAEISSARELSADERRALEAQVALLTGKAVRAHYSTDGSLLGGAVVRIGSTIYDGSVRGQLHRMKEELAE